MSTTEANVLAAVQELIEIQGSLEDDTIDEPDYIQERKPLLTLLLGSAARIGTRLMRKYLKQLTDANAITNEEKSAVLLEARKTIIPENAAVANNQTTNSAEVTDNLNHNSTIGNGNFDTKSTTNTANAGNSSSRLNRIQRFGLSEKAKRKDEVSLDFLNKTDPQKINEHYNTMISFIKEPVELLKQGLGEEADLKLPHNLEFQAPYLLVIRKSKENPNNNKIAKNTASDLCAQFDLKKPAKIILMQAARNSPLVLQCILKEDLKFIREAEMRGIKHCIFNMHHSRGLTSYEEFTTFHNFLSGCGIRLWTIVGDDLVPVGYSVMSAIILYALSDLKSAVAKGKMRSYVNQDPDEGSSGDEILPVNSKKRKSSDQCSVGKKKQKAGYAYQIRPYDRNSDFKLLVLSEIDLKMFKKEAIELFNLDKNALVKVYLDSDPKMLINSQRRFEACEERSFIFKV